MKKGCKVDRRECVSAGRKKKDECCDHSACPLGMINPAIEELVPSSDE